MADYIWQDDPVLIAKYVLYVTEIRPGSVPPGDFARSLIEAAFKADSNNLARIGLGFPVIAEAVNLYKNVDGGREELIRRSEGALNAS